MEKFGAFILVVACLFMACLNLWNLFKEWLIVNTNQGMKIKILLLKEQERKMTGLINTSISIKTGSKRKMLI
ncbi:hypothetical protein EZS27_014523 [termite gut metagenome]|uniref:Uncharacterized protein n=1 Tax=termite gut metagenome TaxID=433724 RepID=A0A5J4RWI3_9ZZZZ